MRNARVFRRLAVSVFCAAIGASAAAVAQQARVDLFAGGSTFAAPAIQTWIEAYGATPSAPAIHYDSIGSDEGVARFVTGSLDFAATDAPLSRQQEAMVEGGSVHVPVMAGMVAVAYNLPGDRDGALRLTRETLAAIFSGAVTRWDDPAIAAANPELKLPRRTIQVVARLDGSGTTYAFTSHLDAASGAWRDKGLGARTRIDWPGGAVLGRGNEGVAVNVLRADGSIGYVEFGFARRLGLPLATLENAAGAFVAPSAASGAAAIAQASLPEDLKIALPDPAGQASYPIVTFTWFLLRRANQDKAKADAVLDFVRWALNDGQGMTGDLGYASMPANVVDAALKAIGGY